MSNEDSRDHNSKDAENDARSPEQKSPEVKSPDAKSPVEKSPDEKSPGEKSPGEKSQTSHSEDTRDEDDSRDHDEDFNFDVTIGDICSKGFGIGMWHDLKRRAPHYLSDWTDIFYGKVLAAIFYMFFTSIAPAITFSVLLESGTEDDNGTPAIGTVEVLLSTAISGGIFSIFGGQPLCILGVTGPVSIFTVAVFNISKAIGINFLPFYAWTQIWAAIMHVLLASFNMCQLIAWVTRYSCETFGVLIALIYLYTGLDGIQMQFDRELDAALLSLWLSLGTFFLANRLSRATDWVVFTPMIRELISDYGATISIIFFSFVPYMSPEARNTDVETLDVPTSFQTTSDRGWFVNLGDISAGGVFAAIIPGFILTVLFFFDHNVSSLLCQSADLGLKKGSAYHWDFFVVGITVLITGLLGIPPTNGLIPQAPLHSKALTVTEKYTDSSGQTRERILHVYEQRASNFFQALLIGVMLSAPFLTVISYIPRSTLDGLFLYMGVESFPGNQFAERLSLLVTQSELRKSDHAFLEKLTWPRLRNFTLFQALCCVIIFAITFTEAAMIFPLLIASLVILRKLAFPRFFTQEELNSVDTSLHACADEDDEGEDDGMESSYHGKPKSAQAKADIQGVDIKRNGDSIEMKSLPQPANRASSIGAIQIPPQRTV
mmetsp:Transcript_12119/g.16919  ORF Transcript_12119/g.16919 Transcript_12119/m.16919 type:complete len:660 (+) Transcript_12119:311-2290(+)|eukprot:CAMPEP_0184487490 /NCGR_PEP_ID=MMETSP0113_2-20130426/10145_1 /TAXON_ID=91329 /ORGANISM="Norrisiella sphaerica, Strain BC52" /LENGTH=659 /DNA_ID=CAMNT_0026869821 /DNA_START=226 /DNA_END=2205 /DNA_ORIENTATION=+